MIMLFDIALRELSPKGCSDLEIGPEGTGFVSALKTVETIFNGQSYRV